ncbi:hypothetical protein [Burkholderia ambifaria]|uniref:hypothetical protein n=1 Tax=Burkholderia ambifaria TaxID=152480 RepID=UPI00158D9B2B|nr:hypothetical protein [Burkholderia ambifaria]
MCRPIEMTRAARGACVAFALALLGNALPAWSGADTNPAPRTSPARHRITELIGANGWPGSDEDIPYWQRMGLRWGRDSVGPGQPGPHDGRIDIDRTGPSYGAELPPILLRNNRNGIKSLLFVGYTPAWNASVPGDGFSAPKDVAVWERYVEAVVKKYSAPPYNVKYFQIWNEAAGPLSGGSPQASFWHGPGNNRNAALARPYADAMRDYVERIHIPAARIIRKYHAYVVYGGWPDQGGLDNYMRWLEYTSPTAHARMLDWVDYLDVHYLGLDSLDRLYQRYVATGKVRGLWQTEMGDTYIDNPNYLPTYFFDLAAWALDRNWDDPDKYVSMIYHWDGSEPYRLTHRGSTRVYNASGRSLITLRSVLSGPLAAFHHRIEFSPELSGNALISGESIVFQVGGTPGRRWLSVDGLPAPASGRFRIDYVDAILGTPIPEPRLVSSWAGGHLSISFYVPEPRPGADDKPCPCLGYLVVTPLP